MSRASSVAKDYYLRLSAVCQVRRAMLEAAIAGRKYCRVCFGLESWL